MIFNGHICDLKNCRRFVLRVQVFTILIVVCVQLFFSESQSKAWCFTLAVAWGGVRGYFLWGDFDGYQIHVGGCYRVHLGTVVLNRPIDWGFDWICLLGSVRDSFWIWDCTKRDISFWIFWDGMDGVGLTRDGAGVRIRFVCLYTTVMEIVRDSLVVVPVSCLIHISLYRERERSLRQVQRQKE